VPAGVSIAEARRGDDPRVGTVLKPKRVTLYREVWRQIKANGYDVIPLAFGKDRPFKGWPTMPNDAAAIETWNGRSAAIRMYGSSLLVIDIDVRRAAIADAIVQMLERRWPAFMATCLRRHSGGVKLALIGRVNTQQRYLDTRRCLDPNDPEDKKGHKVEIFHGNTKKYVGVHGMHSEEDGLERHYGYHGATILERTAAELPEFPEAELGPMVDACEAVMLEHGLTAQQPLRTGPHKKIEYSITGETRFDVQDGPDQVTYEELCDIVTERGGEARVSGSFIDGSHDRGKCRASDCRIAHCVGVFDNETMTWHCPADAAPATENTEAIAELLREGMERDGIEPPPGVPNWRERYENGSPRASLHNARLGIEAGGFAAVHDVFHNKMFLGRPAGGPLPPFCGEVNDNRIALLRMWVSNRYGRDFTEKHVRDAVMIMAAENTFNPVTDMLADAQANWDGVERLDRAAVDHFGCPDTPLNRACVRKTMIAAVARARNPGCKFDTILVLESPEGWNKSSAWAVLAGEGNFSDERIIGKDSREVVEQLMGIWIHENADLAGMRKAEVETVKAYASRAEDRARPAYGHYLLAQPRHSIEVGTTNSDEYLQSQTGNRRFWPIKMARRIDLAALRAARLQLWGEAAHYQAQGESITLDEELWASAAVQQEARRVRDPWEPMLENLSLASVTGPLAGVGYIGNGIVHVVEGEQRVATAVIFEHVIRIPSHLLQVTHAKRLADVMRALGWDTKVFKLEGKTVRGYARKA